MLYEVLLFLSSHQRTILINLQGCTYTNLYACVSACHSNGSMLQPMLDPNELHFMLRQTAQGPHTMLQFICLAPILDRVCPSHNLTL